SGPGRRAGQRERRGDRAGTSPGLQRRAAREHAGPRDGSSRLALWAGDHVHRRWPGHRLDLGEGLAIGERDPRAVRAMFDSIARRYDLVNTVLSLGSDGGWRRRAARETGLRPGGSAVDVACGSGKLTAELAKIAGPAGRVVGVDFSPQMLEVARRAHPGLEFLEGDALNLQFDDASFDASTIAFGLRNLADPVRGMREMLRVVRP